MRSKKLKKMHTSAVDSAEPRCCQLGETLRHAVQRLAALGLVIPGEPLVDTSYGGVSR